MNDEIPYQPFERDIIGPHGAILLRRNRSHAKDCVKAIQRRTHPAWSMLNCSYRVLEAA